MLQKEADLQRTIAEETKRMAHHRKEMLKTQKTSQSTRNPSRLLMKSSIRLLLSQ